MYSWGLINNVTDTHSLGYTLLSLWNTPSHNTHIEHIWTRSLSVVFWFRPRMYRFVFDSCSPAGPGPMLLLRLVLSVPLCEPVLELELLLVLAGEAAVGTRWDPYCNKPVLSETTYSGTRLQQQRLMRHLIYSTTYAVVSISSSPLTIKLYSSVEMTLVYNATKYCPFHDVITEYSCICVSWHLLMFYEQDFNIKYYSHLHVWHVSKTFFSEWKNMCNDRLHIT